MPAKDSSPSHPWTPQRITMLVLLAAILAAGALVGMTWYVGVHKVLHGLAHPRWAWLGPAVGGEIVAYAGYTFAYREVASVEGGAELEVPEAAALVASGFGAFVHAGGFALDRLALRSAGLSGPEARRRVLGLGALEYAVLAPATLVAALVVLLRHQGVSMALTLPWIVGVPVGAALALTALRYRCVVTRWRLIGKPLDSGLRSLQLVLRLFRSPRRHGAALIGTVLYWGGDIFALWSTLHMFSAQTPPVAQLVVGYSTGYSLTRRTLPLGGAGIIEVFLPISLGWLEISLAPALLAVFAYRLVNLWLPLIPALAGLPTIRRLERHADARRRRARRLGAERT